MRIARVMTRLNLGGPARQALASDPRLVARGHELLVLVGQPEPGEGDLFDELRGRGLDVRRVEGLARSLSWRDFLVARRLRRELAAFRPDVVHTHASKAGALGRAALRAPAFARTARVHTFHGHVLEGYFPAPISARLVAAERRLARETDRVVAVSHATADDLVRFGVCAEERLIVIQPGVELEALLALERGRRGTAAEALRAFLGVAPETCLVGVVGRLAEVKQPLAALGLFRALAARHPRLALVFVGDGELRRSLERELEALPPELARRAHLLGARTDMPVVMDALDLVLLTSRTEGMPVALIEAAAAALPVVARAVGGVSELVAHERTGWLGTSDDELLFGLDRLLGDPAERSRLGRAARARVQANFSLEAMVAGNLNVYRGLLEHHA